MPWRLFQPLEHAMLLDADVCEAFRSAQETKGEKAMSTLTCGAQEREMNTRRVKRVNQCLTTAAPRKNADR